jgi:uroporphyrinogen decarboxylase
MCETGATVMTGLERTLAAIGDGTPDVVPCGPFAGFYAARLAGVPLGRYVTDGSAIADSQIKLQRAIGHDIVVTAADTYYLAEGFGLRVNHYPDALPTSGGPLLRTLADVDTLRVPDPERDGRMPVYLEAVRILARELGDRVAIRGTGTGPFSVAAYLYGDQRFLMKLAEIASGLAEPGDEARVHRLLEICAEASARFLRAQLRAGEHIAYLGDSLSSAEMISPQMYRSWAGPYQRMVFELVEDEVRSRGARTLLHVCGDNRAILADLADTGVDLLEIDHKMNLTECRRELGADLCLIGNLDPVDVILNGSPEDVARESRACIAAAGGSARFILGTGCFVPWESPVANLKAMVDVAHAHDGSGGQKGRNQ